MKTLISQIKKNQAHSKLPDNVEAAETNLQIGTDRLL